MPTIPQLLLICGGVLVAAGIIFSLCSWALWGQLSDRAKKRIRAALFSAGRKKAAEVIDSNLSPTYREEVKELANTAIDEIAGDS